MSWPWQERWWQLLPWVPSVTVPTRPSVPQPPHVQDWHTVEVPGPYESMYGDEDAPVRCARRRT